jgi:hypothetical protein
MHFTFDIRYSTLDIPKFDGQALRTLSGLVLPKPDSVPRTCQRLKGRRKSAIFAP